MSKDDESTLERMGREWDERRARLELLTCSSLLSEEVRDDISGALAVIERLEEGTRQALMAAMSRAKLDTVSRMMNEARADARVSAILECADLAVYFHSKSSGKALAKALLKHANVPHPKCGAPVPVDYIGGVNLAIGCELERWHEGNHKQGEHEAPNAFDRNESAVSVD